MSHFQPAPQITHELLEGEVIAINFETGVYFSLRGSASRIWQRLANSPCGAEELCEQFTGTQDSSREEIARFLQELNQEGLLVAALAGNETSSTPENGDAIPYEPPVFEKFDDMSELLLADPIHEVDASGWPNVSS